MTNGVTAQGILQKSYPQYPVHSNPLVLSITFAPIDIARSHGGGLDSLGCHHDRKRGDYHCHRGDLAGRSFSSKSEALLALEER